jgi:Pirin-related protein
MTPAKYQAIENKDMGKFTLPDGKSIIEIIAGEYRGVKGPAFTFTPMNVFNAKLARGTKADFSFPESFNTGFLVIDGEVTVNGEKTAAEDSFIYFERKGTEIQLEAIKESIVLILSGEPINEPIASYGPFVMNTDDEIKEAYEDYYNGKFGYLED